MSNIYATREDARTRTDVGVLDETFKMLQPGETYKSEIMLEYLDRLRQGESGDFIIKELYHGLGLSGSYNGGVYCPTLNRIYLVPSTRGIQSTWHYIDGDTGEVVPYEHGLGVNAPASGPAYIGGAYSQTLNRIYFCPSAQSNDPLWHYVDCNDGSIVSYAHGTGITVSSAYTGAIYSPRQNRIYFVPASQGKEVSGILHYVNCDTGNIESYSHTQASILAPTPYIHGSYSPTQNRIYFAPYQQGPNDTWHYIDCNTGELVPYTHGATVVNSGYYGATYSPTENRIYFIPQHQANQSQWHYVDCSDGSVIPYNHGTGISVTNAYRDGVYAPTHNRIYFVPFNINQSEWHYIDCSNGSIVSYTHRVDNTVDNFAYAGGICIGPLGRIYFMPFFQSTENIWHYIDLATDKVINRYIMSNTIFT